MEKKVTGIDLDELKREREAMMADMGIMPNSASDYSNQNFATDQKNDSTESYNAVENNNNVESSSTNYEDMSDEELLEMINDFITETGDEENDEISSLANSNNSETEQKTEEFVTVDEGATDSVSENSKDYQIRSEPSRNLSHYDVFAQFEINSSVPISHDELKDEDKINKNYESPSHESDDKFLMSDEDLIKLNDVDDDEIIDEIADNLATEIIGDDDDDEIIIEDSSESLENQSIEDEEVFFEDLLPQETSEEIDSEGVNEELFLEETQSENDKFESDIETQNNEIVTFEEDQNEEPTFEEILTQDSSEEVVTDENEEKEIDENLSDTLDTEKIDYNDIASNTVLETKTEVKEDDNVNEILKAFAAKKKLEIETAKLDKLKNMQNKIDFLPEITSVNFVNVLSMQEFKSADSLTFVLGKNESGNVVFESLKKSYNVAMFANENSYELLHSMILSFMLKNSPGELKLALCDGADSHNFNYYIESKYLYGENIAQSEDEICQKITQIASELEERYRTLARFNVRSIDEYNVLAKNTQTPRLSQILVVIDGYYEIMRSSSFEKIKNCLYQILRLGRIAGIFAIVVTNKKIEEDIINFNLPSRIGFKCSENDDSIAMIGELGIDRLANKHEFLYSSINLEHAQHLRQPLLSDSIIKILIDNIEK